MYYLTGCFIFRTIESKVKLHLFYKQDRLDIPTTPSVSGVKSLMEVTPGATY